jgi:hypothetical protein
MPPAVGAPTFPPQGITAQNSGPIRVPPLSPDRVADYTRLFDRTGAQNGFLSGNITFIPVLDRKRLIFLNRRRC